MAGSNLGLAVSGGGDSLALLLLAQAALPGRVEAATVDHGLRPESASEAELVSRYCAEIGVVHTTLRVTIPRGNIQQMARNARYTALGEWAREHDLQGLATAHQMDDQAETFLMRLNRGSGLAGLSSIRALGTLPDVSIRLIRPLLRWRRSELAKIVADRRWLAVDDPSNHDDRFDRVRMRHVLADSDWLDIPAIERSARLLSEANDTIEWMIDREYSESVTVEGSVARYAALRTGLADTLIRGGVIRAIFRRFGKDLDQGDAANLAAILVDNKKSNVSGIQAQTEDLDNERLWVFRPENPRRTDSSRGSD
ncbi:tRNA lysidine(34) synthetase TilS [Qipengyuania qiaonensis]|uniref:tRNA(Ile)-lysidine synthase n=1 Tax=Qipengyuania qiaonensis TaxID=2867240 RepID=A0ABS7JCS2_9SPHN|nr:tRNA lysidine(34) synthetase TilS [Qipengyuania qiaonensis]MBX7483844.1 tRNA lysidine(34) synthetase TilS [Qipengyuania qiaonensis]